jgi:hypothetical protein
MQISGRISEVKPYPSSQLGNVTGLRLKWRILCLDFAFSCFPLKCLQFSMQDKITAKPRPPAFLTVQYPIACQKLPAPITCYVAYLLPAPITCYVAYLQPAPITCYVAYLLLTPTPEVRPPDRMRHRMLALVDISRH